MTTGELIAPAIAINGFVGAASEDVEFRTAAIFHPYLPFGAVNTKTCAIRTSRFGQLVANL